ncbi:unnamed protein product, partial [Didymodactylos carnosus]
MMKRLSNNYHHNNFLNDNSNDLITHYKHSRDIDIHPSSDSSSSTDLLIQAELIPVENFSVVTEKVLEKLKYLAMKSNDEKLRELYNVVNHYVQYANNNNEYVLWMYDPNKEGLVLILKQFLNGILYYG